ncbi:MAG TPA: hypothetical protein VMW11_01730 [Candidatus Dormibacteraeota bacterium]|nr:hypothetical protein [Candidatus Dormibacteraeota bacterium]
MRRLVRLAVLGLVVAAVATELAKPADERTWEGRVVGVVPYDFRPPTLQRIREAYWNPYSGRLFSDRVFGVGWAVNLHQAKVLMERAFGTLMGQSEPLSIRMAARAEGSAKQPDVTTARE